MELWEAIVLGVIQGLTEFLPLSSSGHLALAKNLLGLATENLRFEIIVHVGTLVAVVFVFRFRLLKMLRAVFRGRISYRRGRWRFTDENLRLLLILALAAIPAGLAGVFFYGPVTAVFNRPALVAALLIATGCILFSTRYHLPSGRDFTWRRGAAVGLAQVLALLPGISRSGITISAGHHAGVIQRRAAEFSFLLSIPVIAGAALLDLKDIIREGGLARAEAVPLAAGGLAAAVTGFFAIKLLLRVAARGRLHIFAYYCWAVGLFSLLWFLLVN